MSTATHIEAPIHLDLIKKNPIITSNGLQTPQLSASQIWSGFTSRNLFGSQTAIGVISQNFPFTPTFLGLLRPFFIPSPKRSEVSR